MPIYVYECRCGQFEALQGVSEPPIQTCPKGHRVKKVQSRLGLISTTNPDKEKRNSQREYRTNKEVVDGLVKGTMTPPDDRDVCGDKQSRSSVAQFNSMLDHARKMK